ncbi:3-methyl-2-oxobutanoate hydroxymethyltransferase [candidate division KSB1 bacterium]|nr:3-methyl-2-oxobutanoate hydroxymethyltransferase [candidate division KSB1 bacterium]
MVRKVTILDLQEKKNHQQPITMLTAYDYPGALLVDEAGVDIILVGDSLAMTVLGYPNTTVVTMAEMLHHCKAVSRGTKRAFLVGDMPFLSYQISAIKAVGNAGRFIKEANMDAVKLEGGHEVLKSIKAICQAGIPVMGHLGLTPQTATKLGGYRVQANTGVSAKKLYDEALALEAAGCFSIVLEAVPAPVARIISQKLTIPTIGIGAGNECDGQVLVFHDLLGLFDQFKPKFVKQFANLKPLILEAIKTYCQEVEARTFPAQEHTYKIDQTEFDKFLAELK